MQTAKEAFDVYGIAKGPHLSSLDMDNFFCIDCIKSISQGMELSKQKN